MPVSGNLTPRLRGVIFLGKPHLCASDPVARSEMRHGTRQLSGERTRHGAWHHATGLLLRRRVAGFYSDVDRKTAPHAVFFSASLPNDDAIIRLDGAIMLETNDEWTVARRYMSLETLARVNDNPNVSLTAVAS